MIFHKNIIRCRLLATLLATHLAIFPALPAQAQEAETRLLQNLQYEYDALGNITRIIDTSETDTAKTATYTYDDLSRLIEAAVQNTANGDNYTRNYTYSPTGNLIRNSAVGDYEYGGRNPQAVIRAGNTNYAYDAKGNLTEDGTWTHAYDYKNRLTNSVNGDANIGYTYANNNERIKKTDGENTTLYISNEYEIKNGIEIVHVFANGERVATIKGGVITFHHPDHLTGANVATDADGQVTEVADYYPYGEDRISQSAGTPTDYRFTDQEKDTETGLYYYGARYYNPVIGRFISLDPWQGDLADPQSLNKYSYARNNPLKYIDPSGKSPLLIVLGVAVMFFASYEYANAPGPNTEIQSRNGDIHGMENAPIVGDFADAYGAATGKTFSGETLSGTERLLYVGATIGPGVTGPMLKWAKKAASNVAHVIRETLEGAGNFTSSKTLTADELLDAGQEFVGENYDELGPGIYRNKDGNQFRIDNSSLEGKHKPNVSHGHLQMFDKNTGKEIVNNHIPFKEN